jgi:hypothetical protein
MFAGIQEILVLVIVILAIFILPRVLSRGGNEQREEPSVSRMMSLISGPMRLALVVSLVWPLVVAGYLKPWKSGLFPFLYLAFGPVIFGWSIRWIIIGYRRNNLRKYR